MNILLTSAVEDSEIIMESLEQLSCRVLHLPLETYQPVVDDTPIEETLNNLDNFENIVYGKKRSARFFLEWAGKSGKTDEVKQLVNITTDRGAAELLEKEGIPAVYPGKSDPISLVELMLRLRRYGSTLYPTGRKKREEIPGLLQELDMEVIELELYTMTGPDRHLIDTYREKVKAQPPDAVIFHSSHSVIRIPAAFPDLDLSHTRIISANPGISHQLKEKEPDITIDKQADASWESILEAVGELV